MCDNQCISQEQFPACIRLNITIFQCLNTEKSCSNINTTANIRMVFTHFSKGWQENNILRNPAQCVSITNIVKNKQENKPQYASSLKLPLPINLREKSIKEISGGQNYIIKYNKILKKICGPANNMDLWESEQFLINFLLQYTPEFKFLLKSISENIPVNHSTQLFNNNIRLIHSQTSLIIYSVRITSLVIFTEPSSRFKNLKPSYPSSTNSTEFAWLKDFYQKEIFKSHFRRKL